MEIYVYLILYLYKKSQHNVKPSAHRVEIAPTRTKMIA